MYNNNNNYIIEDEEYFDLITSTFVPNFNGILKSLWGKGGVSIFI